MSRINAVNEGDSKLGADLEIRSFNVFCYQFEDKMSNLGNISL